MKPSCLCTSYYLHYCSVPGEDDAPSGSEEDKLLLSSSDTLLALPSIDLGDNFSRRIERKSWRERHEQQKKLIKQRFEVSEPCLAPLANWVCMCAKVLK